MVNSCNPESVFGKMIALGEAHGSTIDPGIVEDMTNTEKASYFHTSDLDRAEMFDASDIPEKTKIVSAWDKFQDFLSPGKAILTDTANPSKVIGEDIVRQLDNLLIDYRNEYPNGGFEARSQYKEDIGGFFESVDTDRFNDAQLRYFERYKSYYSDYAKVFNTEPKGYIEERLSSITKGVVNLSPNVITGNVVEGVMKLPALYGVNSLKGLQLAMKDGGLWHQSPDLVRQGIFGHEYAGQASKGILDKLIDVTDVPLKKVSYYAGYVQGGEEAGRLAVQRVSFAPRIADLPLIYHTSGGRSAVRLLGYTISTYKMLGDMVGGLTKADTAAQSALGLAWYGGLAYALGGAAGAIPTPVQSLIGAFDSMAGTNYKDQINEDTRPLTGLIQTSGISRINITTDIFNQAISTVGRWANGDDVKPTDVTFALSAILFKSDLMNNREIQRIVKNGYDVYTGEQDAPTAAQKSFAPFIGQ